MCFSATASFTAGVALLGLGTLTLRRASSVAELPYAAIPALFGLQQLVEGGLWLTFANNTPHLNSILTHIYSLFSHVLWPVFVPIAVLLLDGSMPVVSQSITSPIVPVGAITVTCALRYP